MSRGCQHKHWNADCLHAITERAPPHGLYREKNNDSWIITPILMLTLQRYAKKNNLQVFCRLFLNIFFEGDRLAVEKF